MLYAYDYNITLHVYFTKHALCTLSKNCSLFMTRNVFETPLGLMQFKLTINYAIIYIYSSCPRVFNISKPTLIILSASIFMILEKENYIFGGITKHRSSLYTIKYHFLAIKVYPEYKQKNYDIYLKMIYSCLSKSGHATALQRLQYFNISWFYNSILMLPTYIALMGPKSKYGARIVIPTIGEQWKSIIWNSIKYIVILLPVIIKCACDKCEFFDIQVDINLQ
ncbi:hypothetical protein QTP88_020690 [Uroleucon formosanum]